TTRSHAGLLALAVLAWAIDFRSFRASLKYWPSANPARPGSSAWHRAACGWPPPVARRDAAGRPCAGVVHPRSIAEPQPVAAAPQPRRALARTSAAVAALRPERVARPGRSDWLAENCRRRGALRRRRGRAAGWPQRPGRRLRPQPLRPPRACAARLDGKPRAVVATRRPACAPVSRPDRRRVRKSDCARSATHRPPRCAARRPKAARRL